MDHFETREGKIKEIEKSNYREWILEEIACWRGKQGIPINDAQRDFFLNYPHVYANMRDFCMKLIKMMEQFRSLNPTHKYDEQDIIHIFSFFTEECFLRKHIGVN